MSDAAEARRVLRAGMFPAPNLLRPETTMSDATLDSLTADYLAVTAANSDAYAAKLAADAAYDAAHDRRVKAGRNYAAEVFRLTTGPEKERIVVTASGAIFCRIVGEPSGTGTTYRVEHAPIAATVRPAAATDPAPTPPPV